MTNIIFIETGTYGGGSFESLYLLLKYIDKQKFWPIVLFLNKTKYINKLAEIGIPCYVIQDHLYTLSGNRFIKIFRFLNIIFNEYFVFLSLIWEYLAHYSAMKQISRLIRQHQIEIIHSNDHINRDFFCNFLAKKHSIILVSHLRTFSFSGFNRFKSRYSNKTVNQYIAISNSVREKWIQKGIKKNKVALIHNGIETIERRTPVDLRKLFHDPTQNYQYIGAVGTYNTQRGYEYLLKAFSILISKGKQFKLVFIGNENYKHLIKLAERLNVSQNIHFLEHVENAIDYIAGMDLMVIPYSVEPFGRTLLEAWMMKTPVIITDADHIRDVVEADQTCILIPYGEAEKLAQAMAHLLTDHSQSRQMTEYAYDFVNKKYHLSHYIRKIEDIYIKASQNIEEPQATH